VLELTKIIILILLPIGLYADNTALFGKVVNVSKNDTLNVCTQPNHNAQKIAELPLDAYVGVEKCKQMENSTWCGVYPMVQQWYENFGNDSHIGWVNARYLRLDSQGYVMIDGKKNCDYTLQCDNGKCEVVDSWKRDKNYHVINLKTRWIDRARLRGESNFGVTAENEDGICNKSVYVYEYLKRGNKTK